MKPRSDKRRTGGERVTGGPRRSGSPAGPPSTLPAWGQVPAGSLLIPGFTKARGRDGDKHTASETAVHRLNCDQVTANLLKRQEPPLSMALSRGDVGQRQGRWVSALKQATGRSGVWNPKGDYFTWVYCSFSV